MLEKFNYHNIDHKNKYYQMLQDQTARNYLSVGDLIDFLKMDIIKKYFLKINNNLVGLGFIIPLKENSVEIRYYIFPENRGQKYSNLLVKLLLNKIPKETTVYADIQIENIASIAAVQKNGFTTIDDFTYQIKR